MAYRIHVFGASGAGTTTLGFALADAIGALHLDTDAYYWKTTDPPFTEKNPPDHRVRCIERDILDLDSWILSGSLCSWGDPLVHRFTTVVFLHLNPKLRMERLMRRERERYGDRITPGGDLHHHHLEFIDWARSYDSASTPTRSLDLHERWLQTLRCVVLRLDSSQPVPTLVGRVLSSVGATG